MKVTCPRCDKVIAKSDGRRRDKTIQPIAPATVTYRVNEAPSFRCGCGMRVIPLEGGR